MTLVALPLLLLSLLDRLQCVVALGDAATGHWALLVGDCVHNLRCALDYLAWELAGANLLGTFTQFPIYESEAGWAGRRAQGRIAKISEPARAFIRLTQPFLFQNPTLASMNVLRLLDDRDKHKLLTVVLSVHERLHIGINNPTRLSEGQVNVVPSEGIHAGAILATLVLANAADDVEVTATCFPRAAFGSNTGLPDRLPIKDTLAAILRDVETIITEAGRRFFPARGDLPLGNQ
jgi:hypothetical protein